MQYSYKAIKLNRLKITISIFYFFALHVCYMLKLTICNKVTFLQCIKAITRTSCIVLGSESDWYERIRYGNCSIVTRLH